jgi:hypothetical protein
MRPAEIEELREGHNVVPRLDVVLVGKSAASQRYVGKKMESCRYMGMHAELHKVNFYELVGERLFEPDCLAPRIVIRNDLTASQSENRSLALPFINRSLDCGRGTPGTP